ncbi:Tad domain-containing protein [Aliiruegeria sabulilitoris]|uniref:Tad domain-containing protein n=1 Tax=Aliiruegeria sabulilitoris TaxID=1510458 RepID=UPI000830A1BE|nr:Tad domain-containing protein [Aliiruegeria sabulilitoris]NDR59615.1 hypothetical protein [Pseudoruegeria sp. M32A2M]
MGISKNSNRSRWRSGQIEKFVREQDGGLIVFSLFILICMMLAIGMSIDVARFEYNRAKLQHTLDRAVLAAANLEQTLDPKSVVEDYFKKAGLSDNLKDVKVSQAINYRTVSADASAEIETIFLEMVGINELSVPASGEANETLADLEVALVLDNSGSMGSWTSSGKTRLKLLQEAAKDFVETVAKEDSDEGSTIISLVPFAEQVTVGKTLLDQYNVSNEHDTTHCVTFDEDDFSSAAIKSTDELNRMAYFDPNNSGWTIYDPKICDTTGGRDITPWTSDADTLYGRIDAMYAEGWTSIDVGTKWGVAMLDPSAQSVLSAMIDAKEVDGDLEGQPFDYDRESTMKILVVMSDGANRYQRDIKDAYKSGLSPLFYNSKEEQYSYYQDDQYYREGTTYTYKCGKRGCYYSSSTENDWYDTPYGDMEDNAQMTWAEVWASMTVYKFAYEFLSPVNHNGSNSYASYYYDKVLREIGSKYETTWAGNEKNAYTSAICTAAKEEGILIFTIGMDTDDSVADATLEDCATLSSYYYDVQSVDISSAFASIALQINQLRLTQ